MLKACSRCGRIHKRGEKCSVKYMSAVHRRNEQIVKFRNAQAWKRMREHIKERDKYICMYCFRGSSAGRRFNTMELSVHHITSLDEDFEKRLDEDNLITLCRQHHELAECGEITKEELRAMILPPEGG